MTRQLERQLEQPKRCDALSVPCDLSRQHRLGRFLCDCRRMTVARAAVPFSRYFGPKLENAFGILMYHRVSPLYPGVALPTWNVTPKRFRDQMIGLLALGYRAWPLRKVLQRHAAGESIPRHVFVVTFDDGYANNFYHALPVLEELKIPATIFLATAYLGSGDPFPFDDWSAAGAKRVAPEAWKPLSAMQCERMLDGNLIELGAHTHTHADFRNQPELLEDDLADCLHVLRSRFGITAPTFAFPYGTRSLGFSGSALSAAAKNVGALCSLTTESELVTPYDNPFDWGRFTAEGNDTAATLAAKLDGWYGQLRECRNWLRQPQSRVSRFLFSD